MLVENIECRNIQVPDNNGACIRFEGANLTVRNLYAHDSQSGVMTSDNAGTVKIEYSTFERLGSNGQALGYAHALYIKADELIFYKSKIITFFSIYRLLLTLERYLLNKSRTNCI